MRFLASFLALAVATASTATAGATADTRTAGRGTVFVSEVNGRSWSKMTQLSPDRLTVSGCLLSGLLSQRQTWTRVS